MLSIGYVAFEEYRNAVVETFTALSVLSRVSCQRTKRRATNERRKAKEVGERRNNFGELQHKVEEEEASWNEGEGPHERHRPS